MHNCITLCRASVVLEYSRLLMTSWVLLPEHICERWLGTDSAFAFDGLNRSTIPGRKPFSVNFLRSLYVFSLFVLLHSSWCTHPAQQSGPLAHESHPALSPAPRFAFRLSPFLAGASDYGHRLSPFLAGVSDYGRVGCLLFLQGPLIMGVGCLLFLQRPMIMGVGCLLFLQGL